MCPRFCERRVSPDSIRGLPRAYPERGTANIWHIRTRQSSDTHHCFFFLLQLHNSQHTSQLTIRRNLSSGLGTGPARPQTRNMRQANGGLTRGSQPNSGWSSERNSALRQEVGDSEHALCLQHQALHACFIQQKTHPTSHLPSPRAISGPGELGCLALCLSHLRMASVLSLSLLGFSKSVSKMLSTHLLRGWR